MSSSRTTKIPQALANTTFNFVNNTNGGAIVVINGHATAADYELIAKLLELSASLKGHPWHASMAPYISVEKLLFSALALGIPAIGGRIIDSCTINKTNNTSGGLIVIINKASKSCAMPDAEAPFEHTHAT